MTTVDVLVVCLGAVTVIALALGVALYHSLQRGRELMLGLQERESQRNRHMVDLKLARDELHRLKTDSRQFEIDLSRLVPSLFKVLSTGSWSGDNIWDHQKIKRLLEGKNAKVDIAEYERFQEQMKNLGVPRDAS